jgi:hypothetical protein
MRDFKRYTDMMESTFRAEVWAQNPAAKPDAFKQGKEFREKVESGEIGGRSRAAEDGSDDDADDVTADAEAVPPSEEDFASDLDPDIDYDYLPPTDALLPQAMVEPAAEPTDEPESGEGGDEAAE